jgi:F0F1-type ATP synthase assembly protein I
MTGGDTKAGLRYVALGTEFAAAILGLSLAGVWVDRHYGTSPWGTLVGALIGLIGGMVNLIREAMGAVRESKARNGTGSDGSDGPSERLGRDGSGRGKPR